MIRPSLGRTAAVAAVLLLSGGADAAPAKVKEQQRAAVLQAVVECRAIKDREARLNCFDAAAAKLDEAEASGQVVVVEKQQIQTVKREAFGLTLPSLDLFGRSAKSAAAVDVDRVTETVKTARRGPDNRWVVELETGAVWRQIDENEIARDPRPGSKVEIKKAALGSFVMKVDGQSAVRVHRDR
jgi:hypothetical protein